MIFHIGIPGLSVLLDSLSDLCSSICAVAQGRVRGFSSGRGGPIVVSTLYFRITLRSYFTAVLPIVGAVMPFKRNGRIEIWTLAGRRDG